MLSSAKKSILSWSKAVDRNRMPFFSQCRTSTMWAARSNSSLLIISNWDSFLSVTFFWYSAFSAFFVIFSSVIKVWNFTKSAFALAATEINFFANPIEPLWLTPASAIIIVFRLFYLFFLYRSEYCDLFSKNILTGTL